MGVAVDRHVQPPRNTNGPTVGFNKSNGRIRSAPPLPSHCVRQGDSICYFYPVLVRRAYDERPDQFDLAGIDYPLRRQDCGGVGGSGPATTTRHSCLVGAQKEDFLGGRYSGCGYVCNTRMSFRLRKVFISSRGMLRLGHFAGCSGWLR